MGQAAVAKAFEEIKAALTVLDAEVDGCGLEPFSAADSLAGLADGCLDILAGMREMEAGFAGLKARAAAKYADSVQTKAPDMPVQAQEMAVAAEIGCLLAMGPRAAGSFLAASHALTKELPRTLSALQSGTISSQHALVMVDEAATLDPAGVVALEAHFLDPATPEPPAAATIGDMPAYRFKAKARSWREATTPNPLKSAMPRGSLTGGWNAGRTRTAWHGSRPTFPLTRRWQAGTALTPLRGPHKDPTKPAPSPNSGPTNSPKRSSPAEPVQPSIQTDQATVAKQVTATPGSCTPRRHDGRCAISKSRTRPASLLRPCAHGAYLTALPVPRLPLVLGFAQWLAVGMADEEVYKNIPSDEHLRQDVAPETEGEPQGSPDPGFTPGQTNAGQQVSGLASATGYGKDLDPEAQPDGNNPI